MDSQDCLPVIFHNVKEYYSPDNAINCQFSIKENTAIDEPANCFVGIFVVAWKALDSIVAKKSFTLVEMRSNDGIYHLTFDLKKTPSSNLKDDEFYQFCFYDTVTKAVFGASGPFQICQSSEESLVHIEGLNRTSTMTPSSILTEDAVNWWLEGSDKPPVDEDLDFEDTVLIHNKTTMMENALVNAARERDEALMATKQKFESELKQFTSEKKEMIEKNEAETSHLKQVNKSLTERELLLKQSLLDSQRVVKQMENFAAENTKQTKISLHNLSMQKEVLTKALVNKEAENIEQINEIKTELYAEIEASEIRCDELSKSLIAEKKVLEKMEFEYNEIIANLKKEIELLCIKESESVTETSKSLAELQMKLNAEITQKYEYLNEIDKLTESVEMLIEENKLKDTLINAERDKLAALMLQQEEMTYRLSSENEKICAEIQNLKSHENNLVEAHQKELSCHRNRIAEMETISKEEKFKFKNEIDQLSNEVNDKINCINLLEAKMRESAENVLYMEGVRQENLKLTDTIDELNAKLHELEHENLQLADESMKVPPPKCPESGSMHALHIANAHMQKQLNSLKKEKENNYSQHKSIESNSDLARENEEFKLRMCMGKKAFDKQYLECRGLKNEISKLKQSKSGSSMSRTTSTKDVKNEEDLESKHTKRVDELLTEIQKLNEEKRSCEEELVKATEDKDNALKLNEELRVKLVQLVDHYEGKINLLTEENGMLKAQRMALMQAGSNNVKHSSPDIVQTVASVTCEHPNLIQINRNTGTERKKKEDNICESQNVTKVVNRQPNIGNATTVSHPPPANEKVVKKQPTFLPNVMYPPSMVPNIMYPPSMPQGVIYPSERQEISRSPATEIATPCAVNDPFMNREPPSQVISNRAEQHVEGSPGRILSQNNEDPAKICPICALHFPAGFTDANKTEHVNSHFE